jgi:hypothetical protein
LHKALVFVPVSVASFAHAFTGNHGHFNTADSHVLSVFTSVVLAHPVEVPEHVFSILIHRHSKLSKPFLMGELPVWKKLVRTLYRAGSVSGGPDDLKSRIRSQTKIIQIRHTVF